MDFQERLVDDITMELLEKTCSLTNRLPLKAMTNQCPNVSMAEFCSSMFQISFPKSIHLGILGDQLEIKIQPKSGYVDNNPMKMKISFNQINSTLPNDQSLINHIADNPHNHVYASTFASMPLLFLTSLLSMLI